MKVNSARNIAISLGVLSQSIHAAPVQPTQTVKPQKLIRNKIQIEKTSQRILDIFKDHMLTHDIDRASVDNTPLQAFQAIKGLDALIERIQHFVENGMRIELYMVGFPYKSSNRDKKTISHLPDMAERSALVYLGKMLTAIAKIYPEGVRLTLICDGSSFSDVLEIPDQHVVDYERGLCQLASDIPLIRIITSTHLQNGKLSLSHLKNTIDHMEPNDQIIQEKFDNDPAYHHELETTLKRLALELDHPKGQRLIAREGLETITKNIIKRSLRFGNYVKNTFPEFANYIKLSVHFQKDVSKKVGIKLSENSNITPWHGVFVREANGSTTIKSKMDVDLSKYDITSESIHGVWCPFFKAKA